MFVVPASAGPLPFRRAAERGGFRRAAREASPRDPRVLVRSCRLAGLDTAAFLPTTDDEIRARGWDAVDVVFVTGDAYVDHPSFAMAVLGRVLESRGFRVAILAQPDWRSADAWRALPRPRLFYAVSAGNKDSMINH